MHEDSQAARMLMFVVFLLALAGLVLALVATVQLSTLRRELADLRRRLAGRDEPVAPPAVVPPSIPRSEPAASPTLPARATPATPPRPVAAAAPVSARQTADAPTDSLRAWGLLPPTELRGEYALGAWWASRIGALVGLAALIFLGIWLNLRNELPAWVRLVELTGLSVALVLGGAKLGQSRPDLGRTLGAVGLAGLQFTAWAAHSLAGLRVIEDPVVGWSVSLLTTAGLTGIALLRDSVALARVTAALAVAQLFLVLAAYPRADLTMVPLLLAVALLGAMPLALRGWATPAALALAGALLPLAVLLQRASRHGDGLLQAMLALAVAVPLAIAARWSRRAMVGESRVPAALELSACLAPFILLHGFFCGSSQSLAWIDAAFALIALGLGFLSRRRGEPLAAGCFLALSACAAALGGGQVADGVWNGVVWLTASAVCLLGAVRLGSLPLGWASHLLAAVAAIAFCTYPPDGMAWLCLLPLAFGALLVARERLGLLASIPWALLAVLGAAVLIGAAAKDLDRTWLTLGWLLPLVMAALLRSPLLLYATLPLMFLGAYPSCVLGVPLADEPRPSHALRAVECAVFLATLLAGVHACRNTPGARSRRIELVVMMLAIVPILTSLPLMLAKLAEVPTPRYFGWALAAGLLLALAEAARRVDIGRASEVALVGFATPWIFALGLAQREPAHAWIAVGLLLLGLSLLLLAVHRARPRLPWLPASLGVVAVFVGLPEAPGAWGSLVIGVMALLVFIAGHVAESRGERIVGLACLAIASLRVVFHDLSDTLGRVIACAALAAAFFGIAWLYARWSRDRSSAA